MTAVLQVKDQVVTSEQIVGLLDRYQLLPRLLRELVIDQAIASIECTSEEIGLACQRVREQHQRNQPPVEPSGNLDALVTRDLKIQKLKQIVGGNKLESYFLKRKSQLDQVIYSLIRTQDVGVADELYFRIQAGEQSFAELAREYSQGPEAKTRGLVGPVELGGYHPTLARLLTVGRPGQLWPPTAVGNWLVIVRLEQRLPAQLDEATRQRLLDELLESWLQEQLSELGTVTTG
ncbi:peptidylprolyl isomerase [Leptolyngbya sp. FACHB-261]|uniref:peptidylprolyl isomerase n=1 Tax=Leptolyngbya sp. FACHB-261 TaxID=2692806 RepID=UPI0016881635|nr:peptidylprolyl isomerase [Leptolyngbya sp. FACHB-261]MBD2103738.1 peptidylprolyl isomerase [Leptolyngbya sp. FACHB-261]